MNMNRGRNYYSCKDFEHITRYHRNIKVIVQEQQISYQRNDSNLKENESLIVFDQALLTISLQYSIIE